MRNSSSLSSSSTVLSLSRSFSRRRFFLRGPAGGWGVSPFSFPSSACRMTDMSFPRSPVMFAMSFPRPAPEEKPCLQGSSFGGKSSSEEVEESDSPFSSSSPSSSSFSFSPFSSSSLLSAGGADFSGFFSWISTALVVGLEILGDLRRDIPVTAFLRCAGRFDLRREAGVPLPFATFFVASSSSSSSSLLLLPSSSAGFSVSGSLLGSLAFSVSVEDLLSFLFSASVSFCFPVSVLFAESVLFLLSVSISFFFDSLPFLFSVSGVFPESVSFSFPSLCPFSFPSLCPFSFPSPCPFSFLRCVFFTDSVSFLFPSLCPFSFPSRSPFSFPSLSPFSFPSLSPFYFPSLCPFSFPSLCPFSFPICLLFFADSVSFLFSKSVFFFSKSVSFLFSKSESFLFPKSVSFLFSKSVSFFFADSVSFFFADSISFCFSKSVSFLFSKSVSFLFSKSVSFLFSKSVSFLFPKSVSFFLSVSVSFLFPKSVSSLFSKSVSFLFSKSLSFLFPKSVSFLFSKCNRVNLSFVVLLRLCHIGFYGHCFHLHGVAYLGDIVHRNDFTVDSFLHVFRLFRVSLRGFLLLLLFILLFANAGSICVFRRATTSASQEACLPASAEDVSRRYLSSCGKRRGPASSRFDRCVQSREEVLSGLKTAVTSRVSTPSHQSDFHLLSALHLAARVLLRGGGAART
ncbi:hypothetical protein F7725_006481 [Dissostichus mawsoni]|uniref:Uncharacterized protein n=1 Tax=Dissostichus mawsoni TaxID=36200 RepID=A0A7J5XVU6_DISMA|nr:hypothetical protein F7725_006481 [Dissostichus mawsoni]